MEKRALFSLYLVLFLITEIVLLSSVYYSRVKRIDLLTKKEARVKE